MRLIQALTVAFKKKRKKKTHTKYTKYNMKYYHKSTLETLKKSGEVDLVDWALETKEGTRINNVGEKVPRIYDTFTKKFGRSWKTWGFLNNLYWWPLVEAYVLGTKKSSSLSEKDKPSTFHRTCSTRGSCHTEQMADCSTIKYGFRATRYWKIYY